MIVGGVTYYYDDYVSTGERVGYDLVDRITLTEKLLFEGTERLLPARVFKLVHDGNLVNVVL